jgi:hypothetical protein
MDWHIRLWNMRNQDFCSEEFAILSRARRPVQSSAPRQSQLHQNQTPRQRIAEQQ